MTGSARGLSFIPATSTSKVSDDVLVSSIGLMFAALIVITGIVLLATVDLQPPTQRIEKIIPNDRFQR